MTAFAPVFAWLLAFAAIAAGCASTPSAPTLPTDCRQLGADITRTEEAKHAALHNKQDAWKAVIPFAVAARYASSTSAMSEADKRLDRLHAEFNLRGCARHGS